MRREREILTRAEAVKYELATSVAERGALAAADTERDLAILSLLDQLETLLWVLEDSPPPESPDAVTH